MYTCPMHPDIRVEKPGQCPKCGMDLVKEEAKLKISERKIEDFMPLIIIFTIILILTIVSQFFIETHSAMTVMRFFEGFFFLIFGGFKLLNWKGFVEAFGTYDIIAKRSKAYGYLYPILELALAACYFFNLQLLIVSIITLVLMIVGMIGIGIELKKKRKIPCACLGVVFKIPMTWVTFLEDAIMAVMAVLMIILLI